MVWKCWIILKRDKRFPRRSRKKRDGWDVEKTWVTSRTTIEKRTSRCICNDATSHLPSLTLSSLMTTVCSSHTLCLILTVISQKTCVKSKPRSSITSQEIPFAEPLQATSVNILQSLRELQLKWTRRSKELWSVQEFTQESRMLRGWWRESLTSSSVMTLKQLS